MERYHITVADCAGEFASRECATLAIARTEKAALKAKYPQKYVGIFDLELDGEEVYVGQCCRCGTDTVSKYEEPDLCPECEDMEPVVTDPFECLDSYSGRTPVKEI